MTAGLQSAETLSSSPMSGVRVGVIQQTMGKGVAAGVTAAVNGALQHMQQLGATVEEVSRLLLHSSRGCSKVDMASAVDNTRASAQVPKYVYWVATIVLELSKLW
jgi:Asp-tRNA(Asn)/Glu-tRNA(Gln) amidotransferase A subunit family amidase